MTAHKKKIIFISLLIFCFSLIAATRLYPLIIFGETGLGYDTGYYRRYLEIETGSFLKPPSFILGPETLGPRLILSLLSLSGLNTNYALFGSYILFSLILGWTIYLLASKIFQDKKAGLSALVIFALSPVQWLAYSFMFYKQFIASPFLFLAFYFLEQKSLFFILPLFLSFISHRTTAFLALPSVLLTALCSVIPAKATLSAAKAGIQVKLPWVKQKKSWILILIIAAGAFLAWLNWTTLNQLLSALKNDIADGDRYRLRTGIFIGIGQYLKLSAPYILAAFVGLWILLKKRYSGPVFIFFITCAVLVLARSFFYERIIFYLDLSLIIFAGGGMGYLWNTKSPPAPLYKRGALLPFVKGGWEGFRIFFIAATLLFTATILFLTLKSYQSLISSSELAEIKKLRETPNESHVMTFDSRYASWLYGWAGTDKKVVAPGLFWNKWNGYQWNEFWLGDIAKQKKMLAQYQAPLYIFLPFLKGAPEGRGISNPQYNYSGDPCFEKFNALIWKFTCF